MRTYEGNNSEVSIYCDIRGDNVHGDDEYNWIGVQR